VLENGLKSNLNLSGDALAAAALSELIAGDYLITIAENARNELK